MDNLTQYTSMKVLETHDTRNARSEKQMSKTACGPVITDIT